MSLRHRLLPSLALPAVVSMLVLAGCAPEPAPTPTETAVASESPTPTPTPAPTGPVVAFDGDCAAVADGAAVSEIAGEQMGDWAPRWDDSQLATLGGLRCAWASETYLSLFYTSWVLPIDVLDADFVAGDASNSCDEDGRCLASEVFGDTWVGISSFGDRASSDDEGARTFIADIGAKLDDEPQPLAGPRDGWWEPTPTCAELADALTTSGVPTTVSDDLSMDVPVFADGPLTRGCTVSMSLAGGQSTDRHISLHAGAADGVESATGAEGAVVLNEGGHEIVQTTEKYPYDGNAGTYLGAVSANLIELPIWDGETDIEAMIAVLDALEA